MKTSAVGLLAALSLLAACTTMPPAAPTEKERCADALLKIVTPTEMIALLSEKNMGPYGSPLTDKAYSNFLMNIDTLELDHIIREALLKRFTEAELKALVSFCDTQEGRSCMTKIAPFAADVLPACSKEAAKAFRKTADEAMRKPIFR